MAHICMKYILIKKEIKDEDIDLVDVINKFFRDNYHVDVDKDDGIVNLEEYKGKLNYSIEQSNKTDRCFLYLNSEQRINNTAICIEKVNEKLKTSSLQRYFYLLKAYDGLSEYYCEKLYTKYATYERQLRYMVLLMVTKAYGGVWVAHTLSEEDKAAVLDKARKQHIAQVPMDSILEYFELKQLENYLFEPPITDMEKFVNEELTPQIIEQLEKKEICELIEKAKKPTCLWERVFSDIGDMKKWKTAMRKVHDVRNSVAHHKTVTNTEYRETLNNLKYINGMIVTAIDSIIANELEETKMIDILGTFATVAGNVLMNTYNFSTLKELFTSFSKRMKELVKPIESNFQQSTVDAIKESALKFSSMDVTDGYKETLQSLVNSFTSYDVLASDSIEEIGRICKQYQMGAIGMNARFENLAEQIMRVNTPDLNKSNTDNL